MSPGPSEYSHFFNFHFEFTGEDTGMFCLRFSAFVLVVMLAGNLKNERMHFLIRVSNPQL